MIYTSRLIKILLMCLLALGLINTSAWADDCGKGDRVEVPSCVTTSWDNYKKRVFWNYHDVTLTNNCSETVTLKGDSSDTDWRRDVGPNTRHTLYSMGGHLKEVMCCPRYSTCVFD